MLYPVFSYDDGTEVTASKPDNNGYISLYVEKFDVARDDFISATFLLPGVTVVSYKGYDKSDIEQMALEFSKIQDDIIDYVKEKERISA